MRRDGPFGGVGGYILRLARESVPLSQSSFAERLGVDVTSVQSWESGRRPLAAASIGQILRITQCLLRHGADSELVATIAAAIEADLVVSAIADPRALDADLQPLSGRVMDLRLAELVTWAFTGAPPRVAPRVPQQRRRGPVPTRPELNPSLRRQIETNLIELSECRTRSGTGTGTGDTLLRRQAVFLAGIIGATTTVRLSRGASRHLVAGQSWTPAWADARSYAASCAYRGDPEPLRHFIAHAHISEDCETAALNYTAYWVGDLPDSQGDDHFMIRAQRPWRGIRMYPHLVARLQPDHPLIDLNIHNLWLLLRAQSGLILDDRETTTVLVGHLDSLMDDDRISKQSRRALGSIAEILAALVPEEWSRQT